MPEELVPTAPRRWTCGIVSMNRVCMSCEPSQRLKLTMLFLIREVCGGTGRSRRHTVFVPQTKEIHVRMRCTGRPAPDSHRVCPANEAIMRICSDCGICLLFAVFCVCSYTLKSACVRASGSVSSSHSLEYVVLLPPSNGGICTMIYRSRCVTLFVACTWVKRR